MPPPSSPARTARMAAKLSPRCSSPFAAQPLDRAHEDEVEQAVRVVAVVAAHEVERVAVDAGRRHELAEGHRVAVGAVRDRQQQALVAGVEDAPEGHREAALHLAPAPS